MQRDCNGPTNQWGLYHSLERRFADRRTHLRGQSKIDTVTVSKRDCVGIDNWEILYFPEWRDVQAALKAKRRELMIEFISKGHSARSVFELLSSP
jgi:hypothetical protein